jgi:hypothetical protein
MRRQMPRCLRWSRCVTSPPRCELPSESCSHAASLHAVRSL